MQITTLLTELRANKPFAIGLISLLTGIIMAFLGSTTLFILAAVFTLAVGVPYPSIFRSMTSRLIAGFLLLFSIIQIAASIQFLVAPTSTFSLLCLIVGVIVIGLAVGLRKRVPISKFTLWDRKDTAAILAIACFIVPFSLLCFWKNDTTNITAFASAQSMDGASHYIGITEMGGIQHLNYQTTQYYPRGFHIAQALLMNAAHEHQADQSWEMNARTYVATYMAWGALLMYVLLYLAGQLLAEFFNSTKRTLPIFLAAATLGPIVAFLYILPFAHEGFLNYYAICASVVLGAIFLAQYRPKEKLSNWFIVAYLLLIFSVSMSWGPLLAPVLIVAPILYVWQSKLDLKQTMKWFARREQWGLMGAFALQVVPFYLHFKYANLTSAQGINATGGVTAFHFGIILAGVAMVLYILLSSRFSRSLKWFASYFLTPFIGLVILFVCIQYGMVGEIRYYAIKTAYLLELLILACAAALLIYELTRANIGALQRWLVAVIAFGASVVLLLGMTANPLAITRSMFAGLAHPDSRNHDFELFSQLGRQGKLGGTNTVSLHYNPDTHKLQGNALISNWANLMQHNVDSTAASAACTGKIFTLQTFSAGTPADQDQLVAAVRDCIAQARARNREYFIVTDQASLGKLRDMFGDSATYVY